MNAPAKRAGTPDRGVCFASYYRAATESAPVTGGTYTLCIALDRPAEIEIGALGTRTLPAGVYAYTGSAFGAGGFGRVDRHYELAAGDRETRHWHIDYLLGHEDATITGDVRTSGEDVECVVASELPPSPVSGFGASDCDCSSHLAYDENAGRLREAVASAHRSTGTEE